MRGTAQKMETRSPGIGRETQRGDGEPGKLCSSKADSSPNTGWAVSARDARLKIKTGGGEKKNLTQPNAKTRENAATIEGGHVKPAAHRPTRMAGVRAEGGRCDPAVPHLSAGPSPGAPHGPAGEATGEAAATQRS